MKILTITDKKWKLLEGFFGREKMGRPQRWGDREILDALLYLMHTGCQWRCLPKCFPPYQTVYGRFRRWESKGVFVAIRNILTEILVRREDISTTYIDATFVRAMMGGDEVGCTKIGKGSKIMALVDKDSRPIAAIATSAQPHEITLLDKTLEDIPQSLSVKKIVGDKAYDSDKHDKKLATKGIELIAPHKKNRTAPKTQDGRKLKAYKKRWVVERFFAWMKPARRLLNRFDRKLAVFQAFLHIFSTLTLIKEY
jgi:transposase